jgi:hypothetical protein
VKGAGGTVVGVSATIHTKKKGSVKKKGKGKRPNDVEGLAMTTPGDAPAALLR